MEMLNRAIEDASEFSEFMRKATDGVNQERQAVEETSRRMPGENREQHRARMKAERRAHTKI